jgi:alternate signal-mediated exported protein
MSKLKGVLTLLAVFVAAAALAAVGSTYSFWADNAQIAATSLEHGALDTEISATTWRVLDGNSTVVTSGNTLASLGELRSPCGDTLRLEVKHNVSVTLDGDNMAAEMSVAWTSGQAAGTYNVTSGSTTIIPERSTASAYTVALATADANYVITVTYPLGSCDLLGQQASAKYAGVGVSVTQVRPQ